MPRDVLDYAGPHPKNLSARARPASLRHSWWFALTSQAAVLLVISAPIGALTIPVLNHPYGLAGAAVFVVSGVCLLRLFPSRSARWRVLLAAAVGAIATTVALHVISMNTFILENASGQMIGRISWHPSEGNYSFAFHNVPQGAVLNFRVHDLFYNGRGNVAGGELADGGQLFSAVWDISGTRYRRNTKIRVEPGGHVNVAWP